MKNAKLLFLALSTLLSGQLLAQQSLEYCNNRFGFCVTYPVDLHLAQDRPINGDGIVLEADGGDIIVNISGAHNVMDWSPEKLYSFEKEEFEAENEGSAEELQLNTTTDGFQAVLLAGNRVEAIRMRQLNGAYVLISIRGPKSENKRVEELWNQIKLSINS